VPPNIIHGSYLGYCKQILWPVSLCCYSCAYYILLS
jgi:trehalose-6-phosphate synthase